MEGYSDFFSNAKKQIALQKLAENNMENKLDTLLEQTLIQHKKRKDLIAKFSEKYTEDDDIIITPTQSIENEELIYLPSEFTEGPDEDIITMKSVLEASKQLTQALRDNVKFFFLIKIRRRQKRKKKLLNLLD